MHRLRGLPGEMPVQGQDEPLRAGRGHQEGHLHPLAPGRAQQTRDRRRKLPVPDPGQVRGLRQDLPGGGRGLRAGRVVCGGGGGRGGGGHRVRSLPHRGHDRVRRGPGTGRDRRPGDGAAAFGLGAHGGQGAPALGRPGAQARGVHPVLGEPGSREPQALLLPDLLHVLGQARPAVPPQGPRRARDALLHGPAVHREGLRGVPPAVHRGGGPRVRAGPGEPDLPGRRPGGGVGRRHPVGPGPRGAGRHGGAGPGPGAQPRAGRTRPGAGDRGGRERVFPGDPLQGGLHRHGSRGGVRGRVRPGAA